MKKVIYLFIGVSVLFVSCNKFLDTKPTDFLSPVTYYETEEHLTFALAGAYDVLGTTNLYRTYYVARMGSEADEGCYSPNTVITGPQVYNFSPGEPIVQGFWGDLYAGIYRANAILANVDRNESIDMSFRNQVRGEALFLRAYYYFLLVQNFGGVPLILQPTMSAGNNDVPRSSAAEVYNQIINDLEAAEELVLPIQALGYGGRANKSAVRGMLARVCLYNAGFPVRDVSKYERVKYWADKVINDPEAGHALNPDYAQIFINYAADKYDIGESLWEIEFWGNNEGAERETGLIGSWIGITVSAAAAAANPELGTAYGYVNSTAKLYQLYEEGDIRRDWAISDFTYSNTGTKVPITSTAPASLYTRKAAKYRREYEVVKPKSNHASPINWPVLRLSDVMLMYVEAENEISGPPQLGSQALGYLNQIRERANAATFDASNLISDKNQFRDFIVDERSRELCFEALRKPDLIRWGIFEFTMQDMANRMATDIPGSHLSLAFRNVHSRHLLFPIPSRELVLNPALQQNPNW